MTKRGKRITRSQAARVARAATAEREHMIGRKVLELIDVADKMHMGVRSISVHATSGGGALLSIGLEPTTTPK